MQRDQTIGTEREQFQAQIDGQQAAGRNQHGHAEHGEQTQHVELGLEQTARSQIRSRVDEYAGRDQIDRQFEDVARTVADQQATEQGGRLGHRTTATHGQDRGRHQGRNRKKMNHRSPLLGNEQIEQKQHAGRPEQEQFRQDECQFGDCRHGRKS